MEQVTLRVEARPESGTRPARRLRRSGMVPAIVYGRDQEALSVAVHERELAAALHTEAGLNALINLQSDGQEILTVAREVQRHPVRGEIIHLDFLKISLTEEIEAEVGLEFEGIPVGVTEFGGILETIRTSVVIRALPTQIPASISLDVSALEIGDSLKLGDLPAVEGVEYTEDPDLAVATVVAPRLPEEEEVEGEEDELLEGEEALGEEGAADEREEASADDES